MASYDVEAARKAGLTDADIAPALASKLNYDLDGAVKAGIPYAEITTTLVKKYNEGFPQAGNQPPGLAPGRSMIDRAGKVVGEAANTIMMRDPGVDYETGVKDFALRSMFSRGSDDKEREAILNKMVGEGNYGKDKFGRYYVHPAGLAKRGITSSKPIALEDSSLTRYDAADIAGDLPALIGSAGYGIAASGAGFPAGVGMAGLGAMTGKAFDEIAKRYEGINTTSPLDQTKRIASEGLAGAVGEGAGRAVIGAGRFAANPYGRFADPERQALTRDALAQGVLPKVFQFQPRGKLLARFQTMGENVLGDSAEKVNTAGLSKGMNALQDTVGVPPANAGTGLVDGVKNFMARLQYGTDVAKREAEVGLNDSLSKITRTLGSKDPNVGTIVQDQIKAARQSFGEQASKLYSKVDDITGGQPIVPTKAVKDQLTELMKNLPTDQTGQKIFPTPELKTFFAKYGDIADLQTTAQMQQLRTDFRNASESMNLVPGVDKYRARLMKNSVDQAFDDAMDPLTLRSKVTSPIVDKDGNAITTNVVTEKPGSPDAINALRAADEFYKNGIKKFDAPAIAALTRDASRGGAVEASRVVDTVIRPGYTAAAVRVKSLVPESTWQKVQASHFSDLLADSTRLIDGQSQVSGASLYKKITDMGNTFDVVYGKEAVNIKRYASELAAMDGKLNPSILQGNIAGNLEIAAEKQARLDQFLKTNYLTELAKPGQEGSQAAAFIFRPNSPERIATAKQFYGEGSKEFKGLQSEAMQKILADFVRPGEDPIKVIFKGKDLVKTLNKFGRPTLEETFGKQTTDDLFRFGRTAQFVTQKNPNSGGIVSAMIALSPFRHIWKIVDIAGTSYLLRQPGAIKWLSEGIQLGDKAAAAGAITRLGALSTAIVRDKTSAGSIDLNRPNLTQGQ